MDNYMTSVSPLEVARSQEKPSLASKRHRQAPNPEVLSTVLTSSVKDASPMYTIFFSPEEVRMVSLFWYSLTFSLLRSQRFDAPLM